MISTPKLKSKDPMAVKHSASKQVPGGLAPSAGEKAEGKIDLPFLKSIPQVEVNDTSKPTEVSLPF